jgi:hypothetical protein
MNCDCDVYAECEGQQFRGWTLEILAEDVGTKNADGTVKEVADVLRDMNDSLSELKKVWAEEAREDEERELAQGS